MVVPSSVRALPSCTCTPRVAVQPSAALMVPPWMVSEPNTDTPTAASVGTVSVEPVIFKMMFLFV